MSKAAKKSIFILMGLLVVALVFAVFFFMKTQETQGDLNATEKRLSETETELVTKVKQHAEAARNLNDEIAKVKGEKEECVQQFNDLKKQTDQQIKDFENQISDITNDRDKWKRRIDEISKTRDQLMEKISQLTKQLEEKPEPQVIIKEQE